MADRLRGAWRVTPECRRVMAALSAQGATPRFVGGCVRNDILGAPVSDVDIAIDRPPQETMSLLHAAHIDPIPVGVDHGTVITVVDNMRFEITSLRADVATDGRHAKVIFGQSWEADARRRDFTINALYAGADGTIFDPLNGMPDVYARRVRFIGDPAQRIQEDFLRILRFFRFHAWYGDGEMEPDGLVACAGLLYGLDRVSKERVGVEMLKTLCAKDPSAALSQMAAVGVLDAVLPYARPAAEVGALTGAMAAEERRLGVAPAAIRRLSLLLRPALTNTERMAVGRALRLSRNDMRKLEHILPDDGSPLDLGAARLVGYRYGIETGRDALLARGVRRGTTLRAPHLAAVAEGARQVMPVAAKDLLRLGVPQGPEMGDALNWAEQRWIASDFALDKNTLIADFLSKRAAS